MYFIVFNRIYRPDVSLHQAHVATTKEDVAPLKRRIAPRTESRQVRPKSNNVILSFLSRSPSLAARFPHLTAQHAPSESAPHNPAAFEQG